MIRIDADAGEALRQLLEVPREARDAAWQERFDEAVLRAPVEPGELMQGPDGFAYRVLRSRGPGRTLRS